MPQSIANIRCHSLRRSYDIRVGTGLLGAVPGWISGERGVVLADERLAEPAERLTAALSAAGWRTSCRLLPVSEELKSLHGIAPLYEHLLAAGLDRAGVVFALGGGALGDAAGFVAGTYLRGIRWVVLPSTLLGQVDSAIGGKTGVNSGHGKNLIGVFHAPSLVVCDLALLDTLPERDVVSGLGEIVKYGLALDARFYRWLEKDWPAVRAREPAALLHAVSRCARLKAGVVSRDEFEVAGEREVLNFGHTVGHALEAATGYGVFRHGEAVLHGLAAAALLSVRAGHLHPRVYQRIERLLRALPVPPVPKHLATADIIGRLRWDKKRRGDRLRFVLLSALGKTVVDDSLDEAAVAGAIDALPRST